MSDVERLAKLERAVAEIQRDVHTLENADKQAVIRLDIALNDIRDNVFKRLNEHIQLTDLRMGDIERRLTKLEAWRQATADELTKALLENSGAKEAT